MVPTINKFIPTICVMGTGGDTVPPSPNATVTYTPVNAYLRTGYDFEPPTCNTTAMPTVEPIIVHRRIPYKETPEYHYRRLASRPTRSKARRRMVKLSQKRNRR